MVTCHHIRKHGCSYQFLCRPIGIQTSFLYDTSQKQETQEHFHLRTSYWNLPTCELSAFLGFASTHCSAYLFVFATVSCNNVSVSIIQQNQLRIMLYSYFQSLIFIELKVFHLNLLTNIYLFPCPSIFTCNTTSSSSLSQH